MIKVVNEVVLRYVNSDYQILTNEPFSDTPPTQL